MGLITKGMGIVLKHAKKVKPKKTRIPIFKPKKGIYTKQFKKSKEHGLKDKFGVWTNREAAIALEQMGKGVTMKFKKSGVPYVPKGTKPSILTKAKGWSKVVAPIVAGTTAGTVHKKIKSKK